MAEIGRHSIIEVTITKHDEASADDLWFVDHGLHQANLAAAPLDKVRPAACFARSADGAVIGGVAGRSWGHCCEIQQIYVDSEFRRRGIGSRLVREMESVGRQRGCRLFFLETFSFQTPSLYESLGYVVAHVIDWYPHGIKKYLMMRSIGEP